MYFVAGSILFLLIFNGIVAINPPKPHIVMIVSDDMGFNDIGFHGSNQIPTPNIDALAAFGINLNRHYVSPMCSPSRASLLTGKYSSSVGMQNYVIVIDQPYGLGLNEKLMPEYLKEAGYATHIVGKWHLGFYKKEYTPTLRGFDSHIGYLGPSIDYYNHSRIRQESPFKSAIGYDMRKNLSLYRETLGVYATDLFTQESVKIIRNHRRENPLFLYIPHLAPHAANFYDPLQAPQEMINKFSYIKDEKRRKYAAMISALDDSVGTVVNALKEKQMLDNSVILFFCDNGAPIEIQSTTNGGSNSPFKGQKQSPWEGGVRSASAIWSPLLQNRERTSNQLFHISDWVPTFAALAGVNINEPLDGKDIWPALSYNLNSPRNDVLCHLDDTAGYQSYINGDYKYVNGTTFNGLYDKWMDLVDITETHPSFATYGESILNSTVGQALAPFTINGISPTTIEQQRQRSVITCNNVPVPTDKLFQCHPLESPCLFNIIEDPCERRNIAALRPVTLRMMEDEVNKLRLKSQPIRNKPSDERSNPAYFDNTWTWWYDELGIPDYEQSDASVKSVHCNILCSAILIVVSANIFRILN